MNSSTHYMYEILTPKDDSLPTFVNESQASHPNFNFTKGWVSSNRVFFENEMLEACDYVATLCEHMQSYIQHLVLQWVRSNDQFNIVQFIRQLHNISAIPQNKKHLIALYALVAFDYDFKIQNFANFKIKNFSMFFFYVINIRKINGCPQIPLNLTTNEKRSAFIAYVMGAIGYITKNDQSTIQRIICPQA